jgi:spermidine synthase
VNVALFLSVLLIAASGLVYELVASALASYLLGDSVTQFSTVIGTYLFAMGVGSWLSRYVTRGLVARFVVIELLVAVAGGFSSAVLFLTFAYTDAFRLVLYLLVSIVGILVGLEIPLLMRILKGRYEFKDVVSNVLTFDYLGALAASLAFPIILVPRLGLVRAAILFGIVNAGVALWGTWLFREALPGYRALRVASVVVLALLGVGMARAQALTNMAEDSIYSDEVIFSRQSRYQRIVLTAWQDDLRLWLNGHLQFSARDEYRYHESLVHPGLAALPRAARVLVLGGGDGLAVREVLRYPRVAEVTLVDLDPEMTRLFATHPTLTKLNGAALASPKVKVVNADAFVWLDEAAQASTRYDFVVVDFPDPNNYGVGKLYTTAFYRLLSRHVAPNGLVVVQSTSPLFARRAYWCIEATMRQAGLKTWPYHVYVPSFGEWGYVLAGVGEGAEYAPPSSLPDGLRFLSVSTLPDLFRFPADMQPVEVEPNRLNTQVLVRYYDEDWGRYNK